MAKDPRFDPRMARKKSSKTEDKNDIILSEDISNNSITSSKIANNSITSSKIVNGEISDAKMTFDVQQRLSNTFTKKQIVHRRILHGAASSLSGEMTLGPVFTYLGYYYYADYNSGTSRFMYGPYSYGAPAIQPGAERRTRIYAIWSDNITNQTGTFEVRITIILSSGETYAYSLGFTWGDTITTRDGYSNELVGLPSGAHGTVYFHINGYSNTNTVIDGKIHYAELQHLDVFP